MAIAVPNTASTPFDVASVQHPLYGMQVMDWRMYRYTMEGGWRYIRRYLRKNPAEDRIDFILRRYRSYNPAFAKEAIIEVRNAIYQRMSDIVRKGGSYSYEQCVTGSNNGVDLNGASMNTFIGVQVLPELLSMGKVGVYIDAPPRFGNTIIENVQSRPYLYVYRVEDIRSWAEDDSATPNQFRSLLLRESYYRHDDKTGLPMDMQERFRHYFKEDDGSVYVQFYNINSQAINPDGTRADGPIRLNISKIPFVMIDIGESLLKEVAHYQIALLNLASADMHYCTAANFPFYVEQYDPRLDSPHLRRRGSSIIDNDTDEPFFNFSEPIGEESEHREGSIPVGPTTGRRYPLNTNQPAFIHPSPDPMRASMEKQNQLKLEIRMLVHLALTMLSAKMASAESKQQDQTPLESGLSYIGLKLEDAERQIASIWGLYDGTKNETTIKYPSKYSLKTDKDRFAEADKLAEYIDSIPSLAYKRIVAKQIVDILLGGKVPDVSLQTVYAEIDAAQVILGSTDKINEDVKVGILDPELAAQIRGYPKSTVAKAQVFHANRLALIQRAQTSPDNLPGARGVADQSAVPSMETQIERSPATDTFIPGTGGNSNTRGQGQ